jgi:hypothetical protein
MGRLIEIIFTLLFTSILILFGVVMIIIAPEEHRVGYYIFSLLCFSIIGLFYNKGRLFNFFGSLACSIVLITVLFCISNEIKNNSLSIFQAIIWLILFAYPSLKFIIATKFGLVEEKLKQVITEQEKTFEKENDE